MIEARKADAVKFVVAAKKII